MQVACHGIVVSAAWALSAASLAGPLATTLLGIAAVRKHFVLVAQRSAAHVAGFAKLARGRVEENRDGPLVGASVILHKGPLALVVWHCRKSIV